MAAPLILTASTATSSKVTVVVANWFSNSVSVIDTKTLTVLSEIETGDGPRAFGHFIAPGFGEEIPQ